MEDEENEHFLAKGLLHKHIDKLLKSEPDRMHYIFLDEINDVEEWEKSVNSLRMRKNADIYITGSNSKLLSGELATYLTGRYVEIRMSPFSFAEYLTAIEGGGMSEDRERLFYRYLDCGGRSRRIQCGRSGSRTSRSRR